MAICSLVDSAVCRESWEPLSTQPLISISVIGMLLREFLSENVFIPTHHLSLILRNYIWLWFLRKRFIVLNVLLEADLYTMVGQVVDEVAVRLTSFLVKNENMYMMVDALCKCIHAYVDAVEKHCLQGLLIDVSKDHGNGPHVSNSLGWPRAVSIQVRLILFLREFERNLS